MSLSLLFQLLLVILAQDHAQGVAPGDEDHFCDQLRAAGSIPTPDYSDQLKVLMDTWNYNNLLPPRTGSVWEQVDNDNNNPSLTTTNWIQNSNSPCLQTAQVCGFSAGMQDNWLITQLINRTVNGVRLPQVSVLIEFEQRDCEVTLNCQRTFNTHVYERSSGDIAASKIISNYCQVQRVSTDGTSGNRVNETVNVQFADDSQETSFYFAVQDETSCIVITRMIVFYHVCPQQSSNLIHHPETIAPRSPISTGNTTVTASCIVNAIAENGSNPLVFCSSGGLWSTSAGKGCQCLPGYFIQDDTCLPCPTGTYLSPSNGSCSTCPANSVGERKGLDQCTCFDGYYRALQGEKDLPCYLPPTPPRNLRIVMRRESLITIIWDSPVRPGSYDLTYGVYISTNGQNRLKIQQVNERFITISDLPGQSYELFVSSENVITDQLPEHQFTVISTSLIVSTEEGSSISTTVIISTETVSSTSVTVSTLTERGSSSNSAIVAVAALIPSLASLALLVSLIAVTVCLCKKNHDLERSHQNDSQNGKETTGVYYSTVNEAVTMYTDSISRPKMEMNIAYEDIKKFSTE